MTKIAIVFGLVLLSWIVVLFVLVTTAYVLTCLGVGG
jgi:hypothetical protein